MRAIECVRKATIRDIPALKVSAIIADVSLTADPFFPEIGVRGGERTELPCQPSIPEELQDDKILGI